MSDEEAKQCKDLIGTHGCVYSVYTPWLTKFPDEPDKSRLPKVVDIDRCMIGEILELWKLGVKTTGNCCGHGVNRPFISVRKECVTCMGDLGYKNMPNPNCADDNTHFYAKTKVVLNLEQYAKFDFPMNKEVDE